MPEGWRFSSYGRVAQWSLRGSGAISLHEAPFAETHHPYAGTRSEIQRRLIEMDSRGSGNPITGFRGACPGLIGGMEGLWFMGSARMSPEGRSERSSGGALAERSSSGERRGRRVHRDPRPRRKEFPG